MTVSSQKNRKIYFTFLTIASLLVLGIGSYQLGYYFRDREFEAYMDQFRPIRQKNLNYTYISPLIGVDSPNIFTLGYDKEIEKTLVDIASTYKTKGLRDYAIYYRDLNSSIWFGINEDEQFSPASLFKIPIAMAAYREDEEHPGFLSKKVVLTKEIADMVTRRKDETTMVIGKTYTLKEALQTMIINSDNTARALLLSQVTPEYIYRLYKYLQIDQPTSQTDLKISLENYALFFRMMYSSTFMSEDNSEELLSLLTKTAFTQGIVHSLPSTINVSHKFGVYNLPPNEKGESLQELHDCGIIYREDKPYLLCVMTRGTDQNIQVQFIDEVSKAVFTFSQDE